MAKIRRIDFSPDEFLVGVAGLRPAEIGAYWIACSLMYSKGGAIPDDEVWISRACGCHVRSWRALRQRLIDAGKLALADGFLSNSRTLREIERAEGRVTASRGAAAASARARRERAENEAQSNDNRDIPEADAQFPPELTNNYQLSTTNDHISGENLTVTATPAADAARQPEDAKTPDAASIIFGAGISWLQHATGRPAEPCRRLLGKWRKGFGTGEALIAALGRAQREGVIDPVPWMEGAIRHLAAKPSARSAWADQLP